LKPAVSTAKDDAPTATCAWEQAYVDSSLLPTVLVVAVPNCLLKNVQAIELAKQDEGTQAYHTRVSIVPLTPEKAMEFTIDKVQAPVKAKQIKISGKQLQLIDLTSFRFTQFPNSAVSATIASDGSSIELTVPEELAATPGFYALTFTLLDKDKTQGATLLQIKKQNRSRLQQRGQP
jgi:hypothetical protein